jgi:nucleotide-binding universal stress UspA family protein
MSYRDILGLVLATEADESVIAATGVLANAGKGRATALLLEAEPEPPYAYDPTMMSTVWAEMVASAHQAHQEEEKKLRARLQGEARAWTMRTATVFTAGLGDRAAVEARYADLTVMGRPSDPQREAVFEGVLFGSGRPVLIAPPGWRPGAIGRRVVVGWNAKREAARALADARPLIEAADHVTILTIDAKPGAMGHGEAPGTDVAAHLARCGLEVEVVNVDGLGRSEAQALIEEAAAREADLLVIGGYGHARLQEMVFGGVTREIVRAAPLPLLMSH